MSSNGQRSIQQVLTSAKVLPLGRREAFLTLECGADEALRARLSSILRARDEAAGHSSSLIAAAAKIRGVAPTATMERDPSFLDGPGSWIGAYRLVRRLGEGGFGVVYLAEQDVPIRRRVALKLIKRGMDTRQVLQRFEAERQAMERMEHPGIARVLDAGATRDGRPFFVMELVHGAPITRHCDARRLGVRDRLELFRKLCLAVHHAHQRGVVHRDLKPPNVLIAMHDGEPTPKVIDFGVAKALRGRLTDATLRTLADQVIGTPEYMSPEQALANGAIDARSDVYALGVILHELLTGTTPVEPVELRCRGVDELRRLVAERPTDRPSARVAALDGRTDGRGGSIAVARSTTVRGLIDDLRGPLDWVVLKALEKDPSRRYATAAALAADMLRVRHGQPVEARSDALRRTAARIGRRRPLRSLTAAAIALCCIVGSFSIGGTWHASRAEMESTERDCAYGLIVALRAETAIADGPLRAMSRACTLGEPLPRDGDCRIGAMQALVALLDRGHLDDVRAMAAVLLDGARSAGDAPLCAWSTFVVAAAEARQGRIDEAHRLLDEADEMARSIVDGAILHQRVEIEQARIELRAGRFDEAEQVLPIVWNATKLPTLTLVDLDALPRADPTAWLSLATHRAAAAALHELYATRHEREPGKGHDATAALWRSRFEPAFITHAGSRDAGAIQRPIVCRVKPTAIDDRPKRAGGVRPVSPAALSAVANPPTVLPFHPPALGVRGTVQGR